MAAAVKAAVKCRKNPTQQSGKDIKAVEVD